MTENPAPIGPGEETITKDRSGRLFAAVIGLVVVAGALAVLMLIPALRRSPAPVPDVVGETTQTAATTLAAEKFALGSQEITANASLSNLAVVSQQPAAGTKAPRLSAVDVVVNVQPYQLSMPSVVGLSQDDATKALSAYPFTPVFLRQFSDTVPAGQAVSQSPAPGVRWTTGLPVAVDISLGASATGVRVPDVRTMRAEQMQATLDSFGLTPLVFTVANTGQAPGTVIWQLPEPDSLVRANSPVAVFSAAAAP